MYIEELTPEEVFEDVEKSGYDEQVVVPDGSSLPDAPSVTRYSTEAPFVITTFTPTLNVYPDVVPPVLLIFNVPGIIEIHLFVPGAAIKSNGTVPIVLKVVESIDFLN